METIPECRERPPYPINNRESIGFKEPTAIIPFTDPRARKAFKEYRNQLNRDYEHDMVPKERLSDVLLHSRRAQGIFLDQEVRLIWMYTNEFEMPSQGLPDATVFLGKWKSHPDPLIYVFAGHSIGLRGMDGITQQTASWGYQWRPDCEDTPLKEKGHLVFTQQAGLAQTERLVNLAKKFTGCLEGYTKVAKARQE